MDQMVMYTLILINCSPFLPTTCPQVKLDILVLPADEPIKSTLFFLKFRFETFVIGTSN